MREVGPCWRIEVAEGFGREERDTAEETSPLVFVEDVDGGFRSSYGFSAGAVVGLTGGLGDMRDLGCLSLEGWEG